MQCFSDHSEINKSNDEKTEEAVIVARRTKVSRISLNIPAAGLGSRPPSVVSTGTVDEGGFNEPYPEIKAKLKPHEDSPYEPSESSSGGLNQTCDAQMVAAKTEGNTKQSIESVEKKSVEPIYAVPHKLSSISQQKSTTSTDSSASQVTVIAQKSVDSDIMYNATNIVTNSVLAELESQESIEKNEESKQKEQSSDKTVDDAQNANEKSVPFLMMRECLKSSDRSTISAEGRKAEANILDLNDVEYADASDNEQEIDNCNKVVEADAMTPMEAENLLSSR